MTAAEILRRAADVLRTRGWCQGAYHDGGRCCVLGALGVARRETEAAWSMTVQAEVYGAIHEAVPLAKTRGIANWNDQASRTASEVIDALERAAASLEVKP